MARRDASIVDCFWGTGFVVVAWLNFPPQLSASQAPAGKSLLVVLATVWGLRLSVFLLWRNWGTGRSRRYAAMRQHHGERFWLVSLGSVFLLQATSCYGLCHYPCKSASFLAEGS